MDIRKKRSEIPCYWENQPMGCQKPNCAFYHHRGRCADGVVLPPSKEVSYSVPEPSGEQVKAGQIPVQYTCVSDPSNSCPQLQDVMTSENSKNVSCPALLPVVINVVSDDDGECYEEGDDNKAPASQPASKVLDQLPVAALWKPENNLNPEKVNVPTVTLSSKQERPWVRRSLAERLGKRKFSVGGDSYSPLKRSLAERLGGKLEAPERNTDKTHQEGRISKSLKERLGMPAGLDKAEVSEKETKVGEVHVKTLEEILLERTGQKGGKLQTKFKMDRPSKAEDCVSGKRNSSTLQIKTFTEVLADIKQQQQDLEGQEGSKGGTCIQPKADSEPKENAKKQEESSSFSLLPQPQSIPSSKKVNAWTVVKTITFSSKQEEPLLRRSLAERLGKRKFSVVGDSYSPLKRSLAERLGGKLEAPERNIDKTHQEGRISKSLKERLGMPAGLDKAEVSEKETKVGEVHVKTLKEILLERTGQKGGKLQTKFKMDRPSKAEDCASGKRNSSSLQIKTFTEVLADIKQQQQDLEGQEGSKGGTCIQPKAEMKKTVVLPQIVLGKGQSKEPAGRTMSLQHVHVKTLEEIKLEKALRSMEKSTSSQPDPEATQATRWLGQITKKARMREEKTLIGCEAASQSSDARIEASEASHEPAGVAARAVKRCDPLREDRLQKRQTRVASLKEHSVLTTPGREVASCNIHTVESPVPLAVPGHLAKWLPTMSCQKMEMETSAIRLSQLNVKCVAPTLENTDKAKSKADVKPLVVKETSSPRTARKRKAVEMYGVRLPSPSSDLQGSPAKRAKLAVGLLLSEDKPFTVPKSQKPRDGVVLPPASSVHSLAQRLDSSSSQVARKKDQLSSASACKPPLPLEDDFEKLVWEFSRGELEAEIDLDSEKDIDELLRELSEMIDN
ncbi:zinc finger CCCH domain-containing protein 11A-like [Ctenodactylus gundi]